MLSLPTAFVAFILGFGFLIFIHELGHFLVAKWVGIRCTQFAIGFGPAICSWRKGVGFRVGSTEPEYEKRAKAALRERGADAEQVDAERLLAVADKLGLGETEYRLNYLPLGGYVKMLGQEDIDPAARSADPRSFNSKSVGARFAVISAGVIMNLLTGVIFFVIAFMAGVEFPPAIVGGVMPEAPAAHAYAVGHEGDPAYRGLRVGDRITHIDGKEAMDFTDVRLASALGAAGEALELVVRREGVPEPLVYRVVPRVNDVDQGLLSMGLMPPVSTRIGYVPAGSALAEAGVRPGMDAVEAAGKSIEAFEDLHDAVVAAAGDAVPVVFADRSTGERVTAELRAAPPLQRTELGDPQLVGFLPATRVISVSEGSPAEAAGFRAGDLVAEVAGVPWPPPAELQQTIRAADGRPVEAIVWRDGEVVTLTPVAPRNDALGIGITAHLSEPVVAKALPDSPAAALDLHVGARLLSVNGVGVASWADVYRALVTADGEGDEAVAVPVRYRKNVAGGMEEEGELVLTPAALAELRAAPWTMPEALSFEIRRDPVAADNPWDATVLGAIKTRQFIQQAYVMILRLAQGTVQVEHLRGPVGIVDEGTKVAQTGWSYLFYFLGLLSVNLAVINFLPIPIADGGHAVFLLAEKVKGSPVSARVQVAAMYLGLVLLGAVFLLVTYHDIARKIQELFG